MFLQSNLPNIGAGTGAGRAETTLAEMGGGVALFFSGNFCGFGGCAAHAAIVMEFVGENTHACTRSSSKRQV
jgi:hypothetical protein